MTMTMRSNPVLASLGNPRRHRRYRRNPRLPIVGGLPFTVEEIAGAVIGSIAVRMGTDLVLKDRNRGMIGWLGNLGLTIGLAMVARKIAPRMAKAVALGGAAFTGVRVVGETIMKSAGVAGVVDHGSSRGAVPITELGAPLTFATDQRGIGAPLVLDNVGAGFNVNTFDLGRGFPGNMGGRMWSMRRRGL